MALSLENHTVNRINNALALSKDMDLRQRVNEWITQNHGVVPDQFLSLDVFLQCYREATKSSSEHIARFMTAQIYQAITWLYSRYNIVLDPRLRTEIVTTKIDTEFHGEVLRRLPEWTVRLEVSYMAEDAVDKKPLGIDILASRAVVDGIDAAIITLTTVAGSAMEDTQYRTYVLDLSKKTLMSAVLSLSDWNTSPLDGSQFDPDELGLLSRFMPSLLFVCSQLPTQPKSQGAIQHQNVKVKQKGKQWTLQPANKINTHCHGLELAEVLWSDAEYQLQLLGNIQSGADTGTTPVALAQFIGEWDDPESEDPTFHYDWIPPVFDEINEGE